jgi:hypothetical protein
MYLQYLFTFEPFILPGQTGRRPATLRCHMLGQSHYAPVVGWRIGGNSELCIRNVVMLLRTTVILLYGSLEHISENYWN